MKILSNNNSHSRILRNTLSIVAIITLFSLNSCVMPSSVRGKKVYGTDETLANDKERLDKRKKVDENIESEEFAKLMEEATKQSIASSTTTTEIKTETADISNLLLPLNKQIENLSKNQTEIKGSISIINRDVSNMKSDIAEIKDALKKLANKKNIASTGSEDDDVVDRKKDKFVMKSDEAVKEEKKDKTNNKSNIKPKKENKVVETPKKDLAKETPKEENNNQSVGNVSDLNKLSFELTENYLKNKDYSKAISKLKEIESGLTTALEKSTQNYYLGESYFGLQQYQKAIDYFIKVLESPEFNKKEDAKVMIAESQIRNGQTDNARETFKQLIAEYPKSEHIPRARKMLQKL